MQRRLLLLALVAISLSNVMAYDFSAVAPSGQTLYYKISGGNAVLTCPNSNVEYVNECWNGYSKPTGALNIPASVTYNGTTYSVTSIGNYAFSYCSALTSVTIPNSVTSIEYYAFYDCSGLTSVTIPNSVTTIRSSAFYGVGTVFYCGEASGSPWGARRAGCFTVEDGFIYEDDAHTILQAYVGTESSVVIPNSVTSIGNYAFYDCSGLTSVTIPNSVTSIGWYAFDGCSGLTSVTIPNSVTTIGSYAFYNCSGLTEITSEARTAPLLGTDAFAGVNIQIPVNIPCGSMMSYMSRWSYFSNFVEGQGFSFEATSSDPTMGYVSVLTQPTCSAPHAVVNAVAIPGYRFDHWSNGATANPYAFELTQDTSLVAYFDVEVRDTVYVTIHDTIVEQLTYYTLQVLSGNTERGLVAGNGRFPVGTEVEIAAIPVEGNRFVKWNDDNTENPRRITLTENATYVATFEQNDAQGVADVMLNGYSVSAREGMIVVKDAEGEQLRVFDAAGRLLHQGRIESAEWHVGVKSAGAYFVQVGGGVAQKVVVVK